MMTHHYHTTRALFTLGISIITATAHLYGAVTDITGDLGTSQSGSLVLSGGSSGAVFDSTTATITQRFNTLALPATSSITGQIIIDGEAIMHAYAQNFFVGNSAGNFSLTGADNHGCGTQALSSLTAGIENVAVGKATLISVTTGSQNVAVGTGAGSGLVNGTLNTLIGTTAGSAYNGDETYNIIVGSHPGIQGESNTIHIGGGGQQTACYIDGIYDQSVESDTGLPVYIDASGKLGIVVSSEHNKEHVRPIGKDSEPIMYLRPVSYYLKSDTVKTKQYGLLAEDVARIMPDLLIKGPHGEPYAVRYHELPVLLLNEYQKMAKRIEALEAQVTQLIAAAR